MTADNQDNIISHYCFAWHVICRDGHTLGFTDHNESLVIDGVNCEPKSGFTPSSVEASLGLSSDISGLEGALSSDEITIEDIESGRFDDAKIVQYLVDWRTPADAKPIRRYFIGQIRIEDKIIQVELRSFSTKLEQVKGRYYRRDCDADLGDSRCGVDLSDERWWVTATVQDSIDDRNASIRILAARPIDIAQFAGGTLKFISGMDDLKALRIAAIEADITENTYVVQLAEKMQRVPDIGGEVKLVVGCDKQFSTCRLRFDNHIRFQGFPHIPSNEKALNYADGETVFDGAPLVK